MDWRMQHAGQSLSLLFNVGDVPADCAAALSDMLSSKAALQRLQLSLGGDHPSASVVSALQLGHVDFISALDRCRCCLLATYMQYTTLTYGVPASTAGIGKAKLHRPPCSDFTWQRQQCHCTSAADNAAECVLTRVQGCKARAPGSCSVRRAPVSCHRLRACTPSRWKHPSCTHWWQMQPATAALRMATAEAARQEAAKPAAEPVTESSLSWLQVSTRQD